MAKTKNSLQIIFLFLMFLAVPVTVYLANQPQEVRTKAEQITEPRPPVDPLLITPTPTPM